MQKQGTSSLLIASKNATKSGADSADPSDANQGKGQSTSRNARASNGSGQDGQPSGQGSAPTETERMNDPLTHGPGNGAGTGDHLGSAFSGKEPPREVLERLFKGQPLPATAPQYQSQRRPSSTPPSRESQPPSAAQLAEQKLQAQVKRIDAGREQRIQATAPWRENPRQLQQVRDW